MSDISYINFNSMSDKALSKHIGAFIRHHRIDQNKTQEGLAYAAGISRSTLSLLERGETVTLSTFIQVLRVLDKLSVLDAFSIEQPSMSPLALAKMEKYKRKRARNKKPEAPENMEHTDW